MTEEIMVKLIAYNSQEFEQAASLRYESFFAEHNLPWILVADKDRKNCFHAAITFSNRVVAYGQLIPQSNGIYRICQMVVAPEYRRQNLGSRILFFLIELAKTEKAIALTLNARLTAVGFYQKQSFQNCGTPFPSTTRIMHMTTNRKLDT